MKKKTWLVLFFIMTIMSLFNPTVHSIRSWLVFVVFHYNELSISFKVEERVGGYHCSHHRLGWVVGEKRGSAMKTSPQYGVICAQQTADWANRLINSRGVLLAQSVNEDSTLQRLRRIIWSCCTTCVCGRDAEGEGQIGYWVIK